MSISEWVAIVGLFLTSLSIAFAGYQFGRDVAVRRSQTFRELYERFWSDDRVRKVYDAIAARRRIYGDPKVPVEPLFAHLDLIARLSDQGFISNHDMKFFDMNIRRVVGAPGFGEYRDHLRKWQAVMALPSGPYDSLFHYIEGRSMDSG